MERCFDKNIESVVSYSSQGFQNISSSDSDEQTIDKISCPLVVSLKLWNRKLKKMPYYSLPYKEQTELAKFMVLFIPNRALYKKKGEQFVSKIIQNTPSLVNCKLCSSQLLKQIHKLISQQLHSTLKTWPERMIEKVIENEKFSTFLVLMNKKQKHFITIQKSIEAFDEDIGKFETIVNNIVTNHQKIYFDILMPENNLTNVDYSLSQQEQINIKGRFDKKIYQVDPERNFFLQLKFFAVIDEVVYEKITSTEEGKNLIEFYWENSKKVVRLMENTVIKEEDLFINTKMNLGYFE